MRNIETILNYDDDISFFHEQKVTFERLEKDS